LQAAWRTSKGDEKIEEKTLGARDVHTGALEEKSHQEKVGSPAHTLPRGIEKKTREGKGKKEG